MKSNVLFTQPQKPMLRAGKGTVQRPGTLKSYKTEIDALYRDADLMSANMEGEVEDPQGTLNQATVTECVIKSVVSTMELSSLDEATNLFALGMNSLQALVVVRKLRRSLGMSIPLSTLYTNPSVLTLTARIVQLLDQRQTSKAFQEQAQRKERKDLIQDYKDVIYKRLLSNFNVESNVPPKQEQEIVILTGSTGTLGSYILDLLLRDPTVAHIYCLNRAEDGLSAQNKKNQLLGLQNCPNNKRISFWTVDLSQTFFNLTRSQYEELSSKATLMIHNAWTVNFNLSLSSFKPQLDNLINLLAFSNNSANSLRFHYVSSISSVLSYRSTIGKTLEKAVNADAAPGPNGYSQSKHVAEQIIDYAAQKMSSGSSFAFARVGQIAGAANHSGIWNRNEWFPSMIINSVQIGAIPDSLGPMFDEIDWVPIDLLADILLELALERSSLAKQYTASEKQHADVYHPLNPNKMTWTELRSVILLELSQQMKTPIEVLPLRTWVAKVRKEAESTVDHSKYTDSASLEAALRSNPAAKLLDFFEHLAASEKVSINHLDFSETLRLSKGMQRLEPINDEWVGKWIREWFAPGRDGVAHIA